MKEVVYFILLVLFSSCGIHKMSKEGIYQELPGNEYFTYVYDSTVNIIDVRTHAEYKKSHIKGAINVSYLGGHFKKEIKALNLDVNKTTLIYCETQHRSLFVAKKFKKAGFKKIIDLDKGMIHWRKSRLPFEIEK